MTKFEWFLLIGAGILIVVAVKSYLSDPLNASATALNQPNSNQTNSVWQAQAGFNPDTGRVGWSVHGGLKI